MIQASELRIGNFILAGKMPGTMGGNGSYTQEIRETCLISLDIDDEYEPHIEHVDIGKSNNSLVDLCNNINPIPITIDWLMKFGFEMNKTVFFIQVGNLNYLECDKNDLAQWGVTPETWPGSIIDIWNPIKHVHQLQNLYFFLTGDELEIK